MQIKAQCLLDICIVIDLTHEYKREALETLNKPKCILLKPISI